MTRSFVYALVEGMSVRYVGFSTRLAARRKGHSYKHPNWRMITLGAYDSADAGLEAERWWIKRLSAAGHSLTNVQDGGHPIRLAKVSEISRARMRVAQKGKVISPETRAKISRALAGKCYIPPESRARISAKMRGRKHTEEAKRKMSAGKMGHPVPGELRAKLSTELRARGIAPSRSAQVAGSRIGLHVRWHVRRNAPNPDCPLCQEART